VTTVGAIVVALWAVLIGIALRRVFTRRGRANVGPAAVGSFYEMLSTDKRQGAETVIEELAAARDPEDADGNLPDLAGRRKQPKSN